MYTDNEKRRELPIKTFFICFVLIVIFIFILMWLLPIPRKLNGKINNSINEIENKEEKSDNDNNQNTKNEKEIIEYKEPSCTLYVSNLKQSNNGWYKDEVEISFKEKNANTKGAKITNYGIGTTQTPNYNKINKFLVYKEGTNTIYGYVKDSYGQTATCSISIKKDTTNPICNLSVLSGSESNGIYNSIFVVGFSLKSDSTSGIESFGISNSNNNVYDNSSKYTISENGKHVIHGYVKDYAGNSSTCDITINRNYVVRPVVTYPSCSLKVTSGTMGDYNWYKDNVLIEFETKKSTNGASITEFGIGTSENYNNNTSYLVKNDGNNVVYGYVKDSNGYTGNCVIPIRKDSTKPTCTLKVTSGTYNDKGYYTSDIVVELISIYDETSGINSYGLTDENSVIYNASSKQTINVNGKYEMHGYIKDNAGNTSTCNLTIVKNNN